MTPNIYTLLVVTTIALPLAPTVQAQMIREQNPVQSNTITTNNSKQLPNDITPDWYNQALTSIQQLEEQIKPVQPYGSYNAINMRSRTGFIITSSGYKVRSLEGNPWEVAFQLKGIGRSKMKWRPTGDYSTLNTANELQYNFNDVQIEYLNNTDGLRQNFLVNRKMPGGGALQVTIEPVTDLQPRLLNSNSLAFFNTDNNLMLAYEDLHVWDANHKALPAAMHFTNGLLCQPNQLY